MLNLCVVLGSEMWCTGGIERISEALRQPALESVLRLVQVTPVLGMRAELIKFYSESVQMHGCVYFCVQHVCSSMARAEPVA